MGPDQEVVFEGEKIALNIPKEGVTLESGWTITPHTYPGVSPLYIYNIYIYMNDLKDHCVGACTRD